METYHPCTAGPSYPFPGTKGPAAKGWNLKENAFHPRQLTPASGYGIGLAHAYRAPWRWTSTHGTVPFELMMRGIDLADLYAALMRSSSTQGGRVMGSCCTRCRSASALPSKKMMDKDATTGKVLQLPRLPMRDHRGSDGAGHPAPDDPPRQRQPYRWAGSGHWSRLPVIPRPCSTSGSRC